MHPALRHYYYYSSSGALPEIQSAEAYQTTEASPQFLGLTFDIAVDVTTAGWTVTSDGDAVTVSSVWSSGTINPIFVLSRDILPGEVLTVSYDAGTGASESTSGRPLTSITDQAVTNDIITLLREDFLGTSVDATKGAITNPDAAALSVTQDDRLLINRVQDTLINPFQNYWASTEEFADGFVTVNLLREKGYTNGIFIFRFFNGANDYITLQGSSTVLGNIRLQVQVSGGAVEYDLANSGVSSANIRVGIKKFGTSISFWRWDTSTNAWVQIGTTQTRTFAGTSKVFIGGVSHTSDDAGDKFSFSKLRVANTDHATKYPESAPDYATGVTTYYDETAHQFSEYKPLDPFFSFGGVINPVDGYFYFAAMSRGGSPLNRSHYIVKYDITNNTVISKVNVPKATGTSVYDVHPIPVVQVDASGHIYMVVERSGNSTGWSDNHNSDILIYKTVTANDLTSIALWKTLTGKYSYPKLWIDGANYYMLARGLRGASADLGKTTLEKSTDSGTNWSEILVIHIPLGTPIRRVYSQVIHSDDGVMYLSWSIRNDTEGSYEACGVIKTTDGVTWSNFQGTFSKNVSVAGALDESDLVDNCQIWNTATPATESITFEGGYVNASGEIKILIGRSTMTGVVVDGNGESEFTELRLFTYDGGWTYVDVSSVIPANYEHFWAYERTLQYVPSASGDSIYVLDRTDTSHVKFIEYSSSNFFASNTSRILWEGSGNYYYGSHAYNSEVQKLFVLFNTVTDYNDFLGWSYLRVINVAN